MQNLSLSKLRLSPIPNKAALESLVSLKTPEGLESAAYLSGPILSLSL
jgi:hypothetical protein